MSEVLVLAALFVIYALSANRLERLRVTAPMFFLLLGIALGTAGLDLLPVTASTEPVKLLAEVTLALLLFADASTISLRSAREDRGFAERLLLLGLPLTMLLGALAARLLFPELAIGGAALIGAMLAPTDAALGLAVVTNPVVPVRIRRMLNIESGLNDGLATPFVMLFIAIAVAEHGSESSAFVVDAVVEMGIAVLVAAAVGFGGGWLVARAHAHVWTSRQSEELAMIAFAFGAYAAGVAAGGNGFVAAFLGGLFFGARRHELVEEPIAFTETVGLFMSYLVWALFGAAVVGPVVLDRFEIAHVGYAVLSLTVVRLVPVGLSLLGAGLRRETVAFVGWFGPRGLASAVFTFLALDAFAEHGEAALASQVTSIAAWTILLSVVAHGITAGLLSVRYGGRMTQLGPDVPELRDAAEPRVRRQALS